MEFDYIIVGAGSAGCVLANRLSADPAVTVGLIEAGGSDRTFPVNLQINVPAGVVTMIANPKHNWMHAFSGDERLGGRTIPCPRGRIIGGSSSINGMIYTRGQREDFDHWASLGNSGWSYEDVLPAFRRAEDFDGDASEFHGVGGELSVTTLRTMNRLSSAFLDAVGECQLPFNNDFNGASQEGFGGFHLTQKNGERWSSARAFLHPVLRRPNLTVIDRALTRQIVFERNRATGVIIVRNGEESVIRARREIVLAAGAVQSPHLLMLSGIGDAAMLREHGIDTVHDLPGVGRNLQDHQDVAVVVAGSTSHSFGWSWGALPWMIASPFQYVFAKRGPLTTTTVEAGGFVRSSPELDRPDIELIFAPLLKNQFGRRIPLGHGYTVHVSLVRPKSRGRIVLNSADPLDRPRLEPNFLSDEQDVRALVSGVKLARQILGAPAFEPYRKAELAPGPSVQSDDAIVDFIHRTVATTYHAAGTCMMGQGEDAVVDERLRVRGLDGLRIADASVMPTIVAAPTNAASIMIGELGASFIRAAA